MVEGGVRVLTPTVPLIPTLHQMVEGGVMVLTPTVLLIPTLHHGGGWYGGTNTNCTAYSNSASLVEGWTNCTASNLQLMVEGGGTNINCVCINNKAVDGVFVHASSVEQTEINNLLYNNNTSGTLVGTGREQHR